MRSHDTTPEPADTAPSTGGSTGVTATPDWNAPERWATMRDFGVTRWMLLVGFSLTVTAVSVAMALDATSVGGWLGTTAMGAVTLVAVLATVMWTPALLTRQGIAADAHAITLVADPLWWFRGRRARIPWSAIRKVQTTSTGEPWFGSKKPKKKLARRERGDAKARSHYVDLWLTHSATRYHAPVWATVAVRGRIRARRGRKKTPKRLHIETTWIGTRRVMLMLWTVRPDYFVGDDGKLAGNVGRAPRRG